jgi:transcriptional regulator with XRE-family HTH domain
MPRKPIVIDTADGRGAELRQAAEDLRVARRRLNETVRAAVANGWSLRQVAAATGLSHQRIHQITHDR